MKKAAVRKVLLLAGLVLTAILLSWALMVLPGSTLILDSLNNKIFDIVLVIEQTNYTPGSIDDVVIIDIDEASIDRLGQLSSWPNLFFADAIDYISQGKPLAIGMDILWAEPDSLKPLALNSLTQSVHKKTQIDQATIRKVLTYKSSDYELAQSFRAAGNVFICMFSQSKMPDSTVVLPDNLKAWDVSPRFSIDLNYPKPPIKILSDAAYAVGFAHIEKDRHGIIHDYSLFLKHQNKYYTNFSFQMCLELLGITRIETDKHSTKLYREDKLVRKLPLNDKNKFYLKYYGKSRTFKYIPFHNVLMQRVPAEYFSDKIIIFGYSATGTDTEHATPLEQNNPGVEIHATLIKNIIDNDFINFYPDWAVLLLSILLLILLVWFIQIMKPKIVFSIYAVFLVFSFISFYLVFHFFSASMNYSLFLLPWNIGFGIVVFNEFASQLKEKRRMRHAFEHYVSKDVVKDIVDNPAVLKVGGRHSPVSVLCSDLRNFTTMCEQVESEEMVNALNQYFNLVTPHIIRTNGMLDKYIGDAVVALYNVPLPHPNYPADACKAALELVKVADQIRQENASHPVFSKFENGVAVTTGTLIIGNIGSNEIFSYTGIGNVMNLSARLEGLNKVYGTRIIIDDSTFHAVKDHFFVRKLDCVSVKGRYQCTSIYEIFPYQEQITDSTKDIVQLYETALEQFLNGHWGEALKQFNNLLKKYPDDNPARFMKQRILDCDQTPPDWFKGVWQYTEK